MRTYLTSEKFQTLFLSLSVIVILAAVMISDGFLAAEKVRNECLRLHILADSDSEADQTVKLIVRDALLQETKDLFTASKNALEATQRVMENKEELEKIAEKALRDNGFLYGAEISVCEEYFTSRQYDDITLPAGNYTALKVILGEGQGHNWWCVMFPPLCIPSVTADTEENVYGVFGESGGALVFGKEGYKIKFRIVEIVENIIDSLKS